MATETLRSDFQGGQAWSEISYDTITRNVTQVRYQNGTNLKADVKVTQPTKPTFTHTVIPGEGIPTAVSTAVPAGRYTVSPDPNDATGFIPDFTFSVAFHA